MVLAIAFMITELGGATKPSSGGAVTVEGAAPLFAAGGGAVTAAGSSRAALGPGCCITLGATLNPIIIPINRATMTQAAVPAHLIHLSILFRSRFSVRSPGSPKRPLRFEVYHIRGFFATEKKETPVPNFSIKAAANYCLTHFL
jgi:hypothetical protein